MIEKSTEIDLLTGQTTVVYFTPEEEEAVNNAASYNTVVHKQVLHMASHTIRGITTVTPEAVLCILSMETVDQLVPQVVTVDTSVSQNGYVLDSLLVVATLSITGTFQVPPTEPIIFI